MAGFVGTLKLLPEWTGWRGQPNFGVPEQQGESALVPRLIYRLLVGVGVEHTRLEMTAVWRYEKKRRHKLRCMNGDCRLNIRREENCKLSILPST